ncbi:MULTISPECIES: sugar phosphate isomerase/epimerase [unclassified Leeuwenhoekiella]|uniref:sugar phosphate isomerase/epimerase family protein n=1 Tax=unclassified Leeuwenhoekiella TaxID=2615029 RepID=UPI000C5C80AD|nr:MULTISPECIES: sugar phosphate isomerase/epimerase family protein [unclassified Leeuwenhoekiella]MAW95846.1 xylose isomerase [Leeuwenhoekiella sp.]MBA82883.1 xylose isomerase [Leeuwenhoekiella sp.]|tara:strand:- start:22145 stop:23122 length:978 start_codon:yes stop_codon:yes gene_type:complete
MTTKLYTALLIIFILTGCKNEKKEENQAESPTETAQFEPFFDISLAQWSLHRAFQNGNLSPMDFAQKANEMGFNGIEYVSQLYRPEMEKYESAEIALDSILPKLKASSKQYGVQNVLIMIDGEGNLASADEEERNTAVENHKKWVDAAAYLGCHAIRVNLIGPKDKENFKQSAIAGLGKLAEYGASKNIEVTVENHGGYSSDAAFLMEIINAINKPNCGTLPDFGNFCMERENGEMWGADCIKEYPRYQGIEELMPKALAVSAKTYNFNEEGQETSMDYSKILKIVKDAGYTGFIGIEYEGEDLSEEEGIKLTKELLIKSAQNLN